MQTFLIDWPEMQIEHALFIENHLMEIKFILHICHYNYVPDRKNTYQNPKFIDLNHSHRVADFYRKYGVVSDICSQMEENFVYSLTKKCLLPEIICIIGKVYSGKSSISKLLGERTNAGLINMKEFLSQPHLKYYLL